MNKVSINWYNADSRSYKYRIEVSDDDINYTTVVDQTARTAYGNSTDNFIASGRYLRVTVTGVDPSGGWAGFYECRVYGTGIAPDTTPPTAPTGLATTGNISVISLDWADNPEHDVASYSVYRSTTSGSGYTEIASGVTASAYTDNSVSNGTTYYYIVTAIDLASNESDNSNEVSATPVGGPIAWWRFEEGPDGADVPGTSSWTSYQIGTSDMTGSGNHLCDYWDGPGGSSIMYSSETAPNIPITNLFSGLSSGGYPSMATWSTKSSPARIDLETAVLTNWTIEALINPTTISGSNRGIVGRDGSVNGPFAPLYFQIQSSGNLRCQYRDQAGVLHEVQDPAVLSTNNWYYVAVVCDTTAGTLTLYKADLSGGETAPLQVGQSTLTGSTDYDFGPWPDGANRYWSVFRGYYDYGHTDRFLGYIDEVRISNTALDVNTEGLLNHSPSFTADPIFNLDGIELTAYTGDSLAIYAQDAESIETLTFSKDDGPVWLNVAPDGTLSGIPSDSDVGENIFTVRVTDNGSLYDTATMNIQVANVYSGTQGLEDLLGLASQWLMQDCTDIPACGGADLNEDFKVNIEDLSKLGSNWQTGI